MGDRLGHLRRLYRQEYHDPRRERRLLSAVSFGATFAVTRAVTHALKGGEGSGGIEIAGRHIHHLTFGIVGLLADGYAMVEGLGVQDARRHRGRARAVAALYGASAALVLDEFALWLDLEEDAYWSNEGRKSVDAVVTFGNGLTLAAVGRGFAAEAARVLTRRSPRHGARLGLRELRRRPRHALAVWREAV